MYHHLDNGTVQFSTNNVVPDQHTTISNKSKVTVTPTSLGKKLRFDSVGLPI